MLAILLMAHLLSHPALYLIIYSIKDWIQMEILNDSRGSKHAVRLKNTASIGLNSKKLIKPIAPREYDGSVDPRAYHRFVEESTAYLIDDCVSADCHISILSHYLTGRA
jgi:hypothetical protein